MHEDDAFMCDDWDEMMLFFCCDERWVNDCDCNCTTERVFSVVSMRLSMGCVESSPPGEQLRQRWDIMRDFLSCNSNDVLR
jgi:hypothetical protein